MNSEYITASPEETITLGRELSGIFGPEAKIALEGDLGAGKTVLAKGLACGWGVDEPDLITSPTFTLINCYEGHIGPIYHVDLYRLHSPDEATAIGLEEILASPAPVIMEWAERITPLLPPETINIRINAPDQASRCFHITSQK